MQRIGRYEIVEQLGAGSMGGVYKARDPVMGRDVAIKTILPHVIESPQGAEFRERFFREAKAAGRLTHPGIVTVFDVSEHEGTPFLVMEYVRGRTLQSILETGERWDTNRMCDFGTQLSDALDYAHRNGVVHRDIKPANILVTSDNRAKIADFGVAKLLESQVTSTGQLLGTPAFMAPEQFTGAPIDGRADLFALGVIIYWMATGDKPFTGDTILAVQYKVVHTEPVPPRKLNPMISPALESVILKSIAKDPSDRYQSGEELGRDLGAFRGRQPVPVVGGDDPTIVSTPPVAGPVARVAAMPTSGRTRRMVFIALLALAVGLLTVGLTRMLTNKPDASLNRVAKVSAPVEGNPAPPPSRDIPDEAPRRAQGEPRSATPRTAVPKSENASSVAVAVSPPDSTPAAESSSSSSPPAEPLTDNESFVRGNRNLIGSPARQKELAQSRNFARLLITSAALPEILTLIVRVDDELLFRHNATPAGTAENGRRRQPGRLISTVPLAAERLLPPGNHKIQVFAVLANRRGQGQELTAEFDPGQLHTLDVQFFPEALRGRPGLDGESNRFRVTLK